MRSSTTGVMNGRRLDAAPAAHNTSAPNQKGPWPIRPSAEKNNPPTSLDLSFAAPAMLPRGVRQTIWRFWSGSAASTAKTVVFLTHLRLRGGAVRLSERRHFSRTEGPWRKIRIKNSG
jgi:hypothetical protein